MTVEHVEFLVEEASMEAALDQLLPKLLKTSTFAIYSHQGKADLIRKLPDRLRGYKAWIPDTWRIVVIVDCDDDDCRALKQQLDTIARDAGLATRTTDPDREKYVVVNRIAIEELEAWFFGDWEAVREVYPRVDRNTPKQAQYRAPDAIKGGTHEALLRVLRAAGYFSSRLRKIEAARSIAEHMEPARNTSPSFCALRDALGEIDGAPVNA
jgi:hypothetical protein